MTSTAFAVQSPTRPMRKRNYLADGDDPAPDTPFMPEDDTDVPGMIGVTPAMLAAQPETPETAGLPPSDSTQIGDDPATAPWWKRLAMAGSHTPNAAPASGPGMEGAADALATLVGERPVQSTPSWLQRIAAATLGGAEGYSNAAGRIRHPYDIPASTEGILHPGYSDKLAAWQSRVIPAQAQLEIESQKLTAKEKAEQIAAQAEEREAHAQQRLNIADPHYGQREIDAVYAKENLPWLAPQIGKDGVPHYYIDKTAEANLTKPIPASKLIPVPEYGGLYDPEQGKMVVTPRDRPDKAETESQLRMRAAQGDADAVKAVRNLDDEMARRAREGRSAPAVVNFNGIPGANGQPVSIDPFIKAIGDYEANPPAARSSSPASIAEYRKIIDAVKQYNPKWDMKNYGVVQGALKDFGSGKTAQTVDAINTVAGHLSVLDQAALALKNGDIAALNRIGNTVGVQFGTNGGNAVARYNTIVHRIGPELGRVYGTATEGENTVNQGDFDASRGPDLIHSAIASSAQLLNGKINSLQHRWETNVKKYNPNREFESVSPEAMETFKRLGGGGSQLPKVTSQAQFNALAKGSHYISTDGQEHVKP